MLGRAPPPGWRQKTVCISYPSIGPHPLVADDVAAGRLVAPFGFVPNGLSIYVSYPKARATDPQVVAFRDWLLEIGRE